MSILKVSYKTLHQTIATFHRDSDIAKDARVELKRRKIRDSKPRKPKPRDDWTRYRRIYGMSKQEILILLDLNSSGTVLRMHRNGTLKHIIKMAKMRK